MENHSDVIGPSSPSSESVNQDFRNHVVPLSVVFGLFAVAGIVGNIFVLYVHLLRYKHNTFRYFVLGLCAIDVASSLTILPLEIYTQLHWFVFPSAALCKIKSFLTLLLAVASVYVLLLISIDRHRKVCVPYGWQLHKHSILKGYFVCFILACVQSGPVLLFWGLRHSVKNIDGVDVTVTYCSVSEEYKDSKWPNITVVLLAPMPVGTVVMLVLYCLVAKQIFQVVVKIRRQAASDVQVARATSSETRDMLTPGPDAEEDPSNQNHGSSRDISRIFSDTTTDSSCDRLRSEAHITSDEENVAVELLVYRIKDNEIAVKRTDTLRRDKTPSSNGTLGKVKRVRIVSDTTDSSGPSEVALTTDRNSATGADVEPSAEQRSASAGPAKDNESLRKKDRHAVAKITRERNISCADRLKRRTLMTFTFTIIFIFTFLLYVVFQSHVADANSTTSLSSGDLVVLMFFYRLYFINCLIHPIIYGFLDPRFRKTMRKTSMHVVGSVMRSQHH